MEQITLNGFEEKEIYRVTGKRVDVKMVSISGQDCSAFILKYDIRKEELINGIKNKKFSIENGPVFLPLDSYQIDKSVVTVEKEPIIVGVDCRLILQLNSALISSFTGQSIVSFNVISSLPHSQVFQ